MKVGDLVRPRSAVFREKVGIVIAVGFIRGTEVRLMCGRIATFNRGSLEVINEG